MRIVDFYFKKYDLNMKPIINLFDDSKISGLEMQDRMPKGHVIIDDKNSEHAFVVKDGPVMAEKLLQFIN